MTLADLYPEIGAPVSKTRNDLRLSVSSPLIVPTIGSRSTPVFNAHSYHTKVPPEAIEPYIAHHTQRGAVVLDPFSGSGMTGVAARRLGRNSILNDLSPAAAHIGWNITHPCDPSALGSAARDALSRVGPLLKEIYSATCQRCSMPATAAFTIWSDRIPCEGCGSLVSIWENATDKATGAVGQRVPCPRCHHETARRGATRADTRPAWVVVDCPTCGRTEHPADKDDLAGDAKWAGSPLNHWFPDVALDPDQEMYIRSALALRGVRSISDFYTARNRHALAALWSSIQHEPDVRLRQVLALAFTNTAWHGTVMRRFNARGGQRPLTGTLYIPHLSSEVNVGRVFAHKIKQLQTFFRAEAALADSEVSTNVMVGSATNLVGIPDRSVDYVFTDPPFGSNIFYSDCNLIWEAWLGTTTDATEEAVVNRSRKVHRGGKTVADYEALMRASFVEIARVLRRDAWVTVVFHSTDAEVWQAIEDSAAGAGLSIKGATYMDKTQLSHKGYKGQRGVEDVAAYDVVLAIRNRPVTARAAASAARRRGDAARILREHLEGLPEVGADSEADRHRTLQYMHSLLVQRHFNGDIGLHVGGYDVVREICDRNFVQNESGLWMTLARRQEDRPARGPRRRLVTHQGVEQQRQ